MAQTPSLKTQKMQVGGMDCTSCAMKIEGSLEKLAGVAEVSVVVATGRMTVSYDPNQVDEAEIKKRVTALGYTVNTEHPKTFPQPDAHDRSHNHDDHDHDHEKNHDEDDGHDHSHSNGNGRVRSKARGSSGWGCHRVIYPGFCL